jgi:hypothetical protein
MILGGGFHAFTVTQTISSSGAGRIDSTAR